MIHVVSDRIMDMVSWLNGVKFSGFAAWPFVVTRPTSSESTFNHEMIHHRQQSELLVLGFYALYSWYYLQGRFQKKNHLQAYLDIPFEKEARANQKNLKYLETRPRQAWKNWR